MPGHRKYFDYGGGRVNYLTHISRRHQAVFVEVPKAVTEDLFTQEVL